MPERRVVLLERSDFLVCHRPGRRHGQWLWFDAADVPELKSGEQGWYEIERIRGAPPRGRKWRVLSPAPYTDPAARSGLNPCLRPRLRWRSGARLTYAACMADASQHQAKFRRRRREAGWAKLSFWLEPDQAVLLERLKVRHGTAEKAVKAALERLAAEVST